MYRLKTPFLGLLACLFITAASADEITGNLYSNVDGPLTVDMVKKASSTLDIEIYTLTDPTLIQEIVRAVNRGVTVRIVKDPSPAGGEACKWFDDKTSTPTTTTGASDTSAINVDCSAIDNMLSVIQSNGGKIVAFDKSTQCGSAARGKTTADPSNDKANGGAETAAPVCFEHGKMFIVDGARAWLSTGNLDNTNLCLSTEDPSKCNRDYSWDLTDESIVSSLQTIFNHDLKNSKTDLGSKIDSGEIDSRLTVSPYARDSLIAFIDSAKTSIRVQNQYVKDDGMNQALIRAANRGVSVQVQVASFCAFGKPSNSDRTKATKTLDSFNAAGIETSAFSGAIRVGGHPGYLHAKLIVVDGKQGWVGSINGSKTAIDENREFGVFFSNSAAVKKLVKSFDADFTDDGAETWKESLACKKD